MAITLITGPANAGKAQLVFDAVVAHAVRAPQPLLILPTQHDVEHYRRELAQRGLIIGTSVRRFDGLIDEIARSCGLARRVISDDARRALLACLSAATGTNGSTRPAQGLLDQFALFIAELEGHHVGPARLRAAINAWHRERSPGIERERMHLLGELFSRYLRELEHQQWADRELRAALALDGLRQRPASWHRRPVLFYGFDDLTALQLDTIETLGVIVDAPVTVSLSYEAGRVAFAGRAGSFQTLLPLAGEHRPLAPRADHYAPRSRGALHHLERHLFERDARRLQPGAAVRLLEGGGERAELELIAEEIGELIAQGVPAAEIAVVHRTPASIAPLLGEVFRSHEIPHSAQRHASFARSGVGAALIGVLRCALADGDATDLLLWLRTPGALEDPSERDAVDRLELRLRRSGETSGRRARALWEATGQKLDGIDRLVQAESSGPVALIVETERQLALLFSGPRRGTAQLLAPDELDEARAFAAAGAVLRELRELAAVGGLLIPSAEDLIGVLERLEFVAGEPADTDRVTVSGPLALRARRVRALFVCGLQEGLFPAPAHAVPLLSAERRRALSSVTGLRLSSPIDALAAERYLFYACVSRPLETLVLSWHSATDDGVPCAPSLFIDDVCDLFDRSLRERRTQRPLGAAPSLIPSGALGEDPAPLAALRDIRVLERLREQTVFSASALETWMRCPVSWFVERMLRARDFDPDPEPMVRGGLAHEVLRATLEGLRERSGSARLTPDTLSLARELLHQALASNQSRFQLSSAAERIPGLRRRLEADLERYLAVAAGSAVNTSLEPTHLELGFGFEQEGELGQLDIGEGVRLRGRIDRIDVTTDGAAIVYDYKGARAPSASRWLEQGSVQLALYITAAQRLLDLDVRGGFYQPLSGRDLRPRGALSETAPAGIEHVSTDQLSDTEFTDLLEQALTLARTAAAEIRSGDLSPRPHTCEPAGGCRYPAICRCER